MDLSTEMTPTMRMAYQELGIRDAIVRLMSDDIARTVGDVGDQLSFHKSRALIAATFHDLLEDGLLERSGSRGVLSTYVLAEQRPGRYYDAEKKTWLAKTSAPKQVVRASVFPILNTQEESSELSDEDRERVISHLEKSLATPPVVKSVWDAGASLRRPVQDDDVDEPEDNGEAEEEEQEEQEQTSVQMTIDMTVRDEDTLYQAMWKVMKAGGWWTPASLQEALPERFPKVDVQQAISYWRYRRWLNQKPVEGKKNRYYYMIEYHVEYPDRSVVKGNRQVSVRRSDTKPGPVTVTRPQQAEKTLENTAAPVQEAPQAADSERTMEDSNAEQQGQQAAPESLDEGVTQDGDAAPVAEFNPHASHPNDPRFDCAKVVNLGGQHSIAEAPLFEMKIFIKGELFTVAELQDVVQDIKSLGYTLEGKMPQARMIETKHVVRGIEFSPAEFVDLLKVSNASGIYLE